MKLTDMEIDASEMATVLALSPKEIYELRKAGILVRSSADRFKLADSITRYVQHLRSRQSVDAGSGTCLIPIFSGP